MAPRATRKLKTQALALDEKFKLNFEDKLMTIRMGVVSVIKGYCVSRAIIGSPGIGKSYMAISELVHFGSRFLHISGGIKDNIALYEFLYNNNDPDLIIVFDDCNDLLRNKKCVEILRVAASMDKDREIVMLDTKNKIFANGMPSKFVFTSRVIIITNLPRKKIDEAIISRTSPIEVFLTIPEKIELVKLNMVNAPPASLPIQWKKEVMDFIEKEVGVEHIKHMDFRIFRDCMFWRAASENYENKLLWKKQVYGVVCE